MAPILLCSLALSNPEPWVLESLVTEPKLETLFNSFGFNEPVEH